jgi:hypothetical protein
MTFTQPQIDLLQWLTVFIIMLKFVLICALAAKLYQKHKQQSLEVTDFFVGVFIFFITLFISRIIFFYFDFYLTDLDTANYLIGSNLMYWRIGSLVTGFGIGFLLIVVDKLVLKFKLKGILGYIVIGVGILHLFYPVYTLDDFWTLSLISTVTGISIMIIPIFFLYLGIKVPGSRTVAFLMAIGSILYAIAGLGISETVLGLFGEDIRSIIIIIMTVVRAGSLIMMALASVKLHV